MFDHLTPRNSIDFHIDPYHCVYDKMLVASSAIMNIQMYMVRIKTAVLLYNFII